MITLLRRKGSWDVLLGQSLSQGSRMNAVFPTSSLLSSSSVLTFVYSPLISPPTSLLFLFHFSSFLSCSTPYSLQLVTLWNRWRLLGLSMIFLYLYLFIFFVTNLSSYKTGLKHQPGFSWRKWRGLGGVGLLLHICEPRPSELSTVKNWMLIQLFER